MCGPQDLRVLKTLLDLPPDRVTALRARGLALAGRFDWTRKVDGFLKLYETALTR